MRAHLLLAVGIVGLIEAVLPARLLRAFVRVAYRDAGDPEPKPWLVTVARIEGAVLVGIALRGLFRLARTGGSRDADGPDGSDRTPTDPDRA